jgi:glycosyltransferase involved in cell wall biosynthesis
MSDSQQSKILENSCVEQDPKIEVFTIWYNRDRYVEKSMESIIKQSCDNYQILAVDDGSNDQTGDFLVNMLDVAEKQDVGMRVWIKNNDGFTSSLKQAIESKSQSEIIALHGAGDISKPNRLKEQYDLLNQNSDVVATGVSSELILPNGEMIKSNSVSNLPETDIYNGVIGRPGSHGETMYYRNTYNSVGGYRKPFKYAQDADLWLRMDRYGDFRRSPQILYQRLRSEETVGGSDYKTKLEQIFCSAAAFESARMRDKGNKDPIEDLTGTDMVEMERIAKQGGLHPRAVNRISVLLADCLLEGNLYGAFYLIQSLDRHGIGILLKTLPKKIIAFPNYAAQKYKQKLIRSV